MIDWVDDELSSWGEFMSGGFVDLGFSRETLEYRMMTYGPDSLVKDCKVSTAPDPYVPDGVARAEYILRDKFIIPHELRKMAIIVYTKQNHTRVALAKMVSAELGDHISRRKLTEMLGNLHHRYDAHVNAINRYAKKDWVLLKKNVDNGPPKSV